MRSFLINKNLCLWYWLRKRIGKKRALWLATNFSETMLRKRVGSYFLLTNRIRYKYISLYLITLII
jgi:hypothetical protein